MNGFVYFVLRQPHRVIRSALDSTPEKSLDRLLPSAVAIFARFEKLMLLSSRSTLPMKVR